MRQLVPAFILENFAAGQLNGAFPAAGLFLDLSGFTVMTETFMAHGQEGAEVLAGVMRAAFEPLILSVYEQGGFIAGQAGDAFTALFPGEPGPAAARALAAAWSIRARAASASRHPTPYGEFLTSFKLGLALGEVAWGILQAANGTRAVYFFQGRAVDGSAESEHQAGRGEIILDASFYEQVQGQVQAAPVGEAYRLESVEGDLPGPLPFQIPEPNLALAGRFFPVALFTQRTGGEFREVVALFISLPTIRTEPQLRIFMETVFTLQEHFGGLLKGLNFGDKGSHLLLIWGAPVAHENDVARALHFALALQTQTEVPIIGGITSRVAHAGFIGSSLQEEYTAFGRGVNLAARFMTSASRGEIWVDENVARAARDQFDLEFTGEKTFRGIAQPEKVYLLMGGKEAREAFFQGALVGREAEMEQLEAFGRPLFSGQYAGMLMVWGEPGIGKSRLVHAGFERLRESSPAGLEIFLAQTDEILRGSFNPFRYWLKGYFAQSLEQSEARNKRNFNQRLDRLVAVTSDPRLAAELDRTRSFLGALVGLEWPDSLYAQLEAEDRYENTQSALTSLLQAESLQAPCILLVEDAHWLDEESLAFLARLDRLLTTGEADHFPIAILITAREGGAAPGLAQLPSREIRLGPLGPAALADLAGAQLGAPASSGLLELLAGRADGSPFFAEQILRYLQEQELLVQTPAGWAPRGQLAASIPRNINSVLVARLDRLAQEVREVVQTAAVLGREFEIQVLSAMLFNDTGLLEKVARARQEAIWSALGEMRYIFRHTLMREAAYQMQIHARRRALHALAVEALEAAYAGRQPDYGLLAYHAEGAGLDKKARTYLLLAGKAAAEAYLNTQAIDYYSRALALTPADDRVSRSELLFGREAVYSRLGNLPARQANLVELETLGSELDAPDFAIDLALKQSDFQLDSGDNLGGLRLARHAAELALASGRVETAISAFLVASIALERSGEPEAAVQEAERGLDLARAQGLVLVEARLLNSQGMARLAQGQMHAARGCFEQALAIGQRTNDLHVQAMLFSNLGSLAGYLGDYSEAQAYLEKALDLARQIGIRKGEAMALGNLGWVAGSLGQYEPAKRYAEEQLRLAREVGDQNSEAMALLNLGTYAAALGEPETALQMSVQGLALARRLGERSLEGWALTYMGQACLVSGQLDQAEEAFQAAVELRRAAGQPLLATEPQAGLARVYLARGDLAAAGQPVAEILAYLDGGSSIAEAEDPLRVYLTCYQVLAGQNDGRALEVLSSAYALLQERAGRITEPAARQAFLENIPHHREICRVWETNEREDLASQNIIPPG